MSKIFSNYQSLTPPAQRVFWIVFISGMLLLIFGLSLVDTFLSAPNLLFRIVNAIPTTLAIISLASAASILARRVTFGAWLFFISAMVIMLSTPMLAEGYGFPAAVLVLVVTILVPLQVFTGRSITLATVLGLTDAGFIILIDTFWSGVRVPAAAQDVQNAGIATGALGILLFVSIFALYRIFTLRTKLLILTLGAGFLSVAVLSTISIAYTQIALEEKTNTSLLSAAKYTADSIDSAILFNVNLLTSQAKLPILRRYLEASNEERLALRPELRVTMREMANRDSKFIGSYALLDANGIDVWDTYQRDAGKNKADRDYFRRVMDSGRTFISAVRFSPTSPDHGFYISAPVFDAAGEKVIGVLRVRMRSNLLAELVKESDRFAGVGSYAILLDDYDIILADAGNPAYFGRTPGQLDSRTVELLKADLRLVAGMSAESITLNMPQFESAIRNLPSTPFFTSADTAFTEPVQGAMLSLSTRPWKVAIVQPVSISQAPIQQLSRIIIVVALVTSFILGTGTLIVSRSITIPVSRLTQTAEQILAGNLKAKVSINSQDELGTLAATLNDMSAQLDQTLSGLEGTIANRTADLQQRSQELEQRTTEMEAITLRSERRAAQLLAVSSVASAIANIQSLDELLPRVAEVISTQFDFYHVGIFLNDASNTYAVLRATNSEGGQRMLARSHRLKIGEVGIVGAVAATGRPRIALDTGEDAAFFNNPDLPTTRSEMALPLRSGTKVIGVLDVQSTEANAFSDEDIEIISILSDQVSTAIRNAQLFEEGQRAANETQLLLQQYARDQWRRVARAQRGTGYRFDGTTVQPLETTVPPENIIHIPITVRGQSIGRLGIRAPQGHTLNADELDIIRSVAERLAISAENARLLQESQERATKEQTIGDITSKISASINLRSIMQTAVEELGRNLPGSEVTIQFKGNK